MFIVGKVNANGTMTMGTPPKVHDYLSEAVKEAERLAGTVENNNGYRVFKSVCYSRRSAAPVETIFAEGEVCE